MWASTGSIPQYDNLESVGLHINLDINSDWVLAGNHVPIYEVSFSDGPNTGVPHINANGYYNTHFVGGQNRTRQLFSVPSECSPLCLSKLLVRMGHVSGGDDLLAEIKDASGVVLHAFSYSASEVPSESGSVRNHRYVSRDICEKIPEGVYSLEFSAPAGTEYHLFPLQVGNDSVNQFSDDIAGFSGLDAEQSIDGGNTWTGWTYFDVPNRRVQELQMFFELKGGSPIVPCGQPFPQ